MARRKFIPAVLALVVAAAAVAHFTWQAGGSNEWRLVRDENGIRLFTLKTPGQTLLKVRATTTLDASLADAVALWRDHPFGASDPAAAARVIERVETPSVFLSYFSVRQPMPGPFRPRELTVLLNYAPDPAGQRVEINIQAAPSKALPGGGGGTRVAHLNNVIRLTRRADARVECEISADVDLGVPYPFANLALPRELSGLLARQKQRLASRAREARLAAAQ